MMNKKSYTIIVPRVDRTGPTNLAIDLGNAATAYGWEVSVLYLSGSPDRDDLSSFHAVRKLSLSDFFGVDGIIHSHGLRPDVVGWLFSWKRNCVVATTLHGHFPGHLKFDYNPIKANIAWYIWSKLLKRFDYRFCISETMRKIYRRQFRSHSLDLAYNFRGIRQNDPVSDRLDSKLLDWIEEQRKLSRSILLYVGSISPRKNVLGLLDAISKSASLSLIVCGDGPDLQDALHLVEDRSCLDRVRFVGQVQNVSLYLQNSDVLVLPSHAEGLPLVALEAASEGVPCLLSNLAVHRELARFGLGETFDRYKFTDFESKALKLAGERTAVADAQRIRIWEDKFSPNRGFSSYINKLSGDKFSGDNM